MDGLEKPLSSCYKCQQKPLIFKNDGKSDFEKRYGVHCDDPECRCKRTIYGQTRSIAIDNWNKYMRTLKKEVLINGIY